MQLKAINISDYVEAIRFYSSLSVLICFLLIVLNKGILKKSKSIGSQASLESFIFIIKLIMFISVGLFFISVAALMANDLK